MQLRGKVRLSLHPLGLASGLNAAHKVEHACVRVTLEVIVSFPGSLATTLMLGVVFLGVGGAVVFLMRHLLDLFHFYLVRINLDVTGLLTTIDHELGKLVRELEYRLEFEGLGNIGEGHAVFVFIDLSGVSSIVHEFSEFIAAYVPAS